MELILLGVLFSMLGIFGLIYLRSGSIRLAFIVSLIIGKTWSILMWAFGFDRPLFNLIIYNKVRGVASTVTVTAAQAIFISFLITMLITVSWPYIEPYLPEPIRRIEVIRR